MSHLGKYAEQWRGARLIVVGDLMLDVYESGDVRPKAEGYSAVLGVKQTRYFPGGAANAAWLAHHLGAEVALIGVVGQDREADKVRRALGWDTSGIVIDPSRPTTTKTRTVWDGRPFIRRDVEERRPLNALIAKLVRGALAEAPRADAVLLSDYGKGVLQTDGVAEYALKTAPISILDPKKFHARYQGVRYTTPNRNEMSPWTCRDFAEVQALLGEQVTVVETREAEPARVMVDGATGLVLEHVPTVPLVNPQTVGAGDAFAVGLSLALAAGAAELEAVRVAHGVARWWASVARGTVPTERAVANQIDLVEKVAR